MQWKISCLRGLFVPEKNINIEYAWSLKYSTIKRDSIMFTIQFMLLQLFLVTDYVKTVFQEAFGRYLDMHGLYQQYVNSKFGEPIEYSAYLDIFSETDKIPRKMKSTRWVAFSIYLICWSFVGILVLYGICYVHYSLLSPCSILQAVQGVLEKSFGVSNIFFPSDRTPARSW